MMYLNLTDEQYAAYLEFNNEFNSKLQDLIYELEKEFKLNLNYKESQSNVGGRFISRYLEVENDTINYLETEARDLSAWYTIKISDHFHSGHSDYNIEVNGDKFQLCEIDFEAIKKLLRKFLNKIVNDLDADEDRFNYL